MNKSTPFYWYAYGAAAVIALGWLVLTFWNVDTPRELGLFAVGQAAGIFGWIVWVDGWWQRRQRRNTDR